MDLYNRVKTKQIILEKFGKDVSSLIFPYIYADCHMCNKKVLRYELCGGCNKPYCKKCYDNYSYIFRDNGVYNSFRKIFGFCDYCITNMIINDN
jgi:hypothetical protein